MLLATLNSWTLTPLICGCWGWMWGHHICLFGSLFFITTGLCIHLLSLLCFPHHSEVSVPPFVLENHARGHYLLTLWTWVVLFAMRGNLGRRPSRFHCIVRLSIGLAIRKLPGLLKNTFCWHIHSAFCSECKIKLETKSFFDL